MLVSTISIAQVGINSTNTQPASDAMLDVSSTDKGLLIPRMTEAERDQISAASNGLMVYLTDLELFSYYDGSEWKVIGSNVLNDKIIDADEDTSVELLEKTDDDVIKFFQEGEGVA